MRSGQGALSKRSNGLGRFPRDLATKEASGKRRWKYTDENDEQTEGAERSVVSGCVPCLGLRVISDNLTIYSGQQNAECRALRLAAFGSVHNCVVEDGKAGKSNHSSSVTPGYTWRDSTCEVVRSGEMGMINSSEATRLR
jgi:hypothetical protein